jgi:hypothetical protein
MRHRRLAVALPVLVVALAGCRRSAEPVARLTVTQRQIQLPHGSMVPLELKWQPTVALPAGTTPLVFVHLLDAQGGVARTFDHPFPGRWITGETIVDQVPLYHSAIGPALPPGDYRLSVGLYDGKEKRFALDVEGEERGRQEYVVAQVRAPELSTSAPALTFSPEWQAPEPGGDRQAVARRWLSGDGSLEVAKLTPPARLWMLLRIPKVEPPLRMLLDPGATVATVGVSANCGSGFSADVSGEGFHQLAVPVAAPGPCKVGFDTNYAVVEMGTGRKLSLGLEQVGWEPGVATSVSPTAP